MVAATERADAAEVACAASQAVVEKLLAENEGLAAQLNALARRIEHEPAAGPDAAPPQSTPPASPVAAAPLLPGTPLQPPPLQPPSVSGLPEDYYDGAEGSPRAESGGGGFLSGILAYIAGADRAKPTGM